MHLAVEFASLFSFMLKFILQGKIFLSVKKFKLFIPLTSLLICLYDINNHSHKNPCN